MLRVNQIKIRIEDGPEELKQETARVLHIPADDILSLVPVKKSIDARKKPNLYYDFCVDIHVKNQHKVLKRFAKMPHLVSESNPVSYELQVKGEIPQEHPIVIVGTGPAGLFCGYFLTCNGYRTILIERGKDVEARQKDVESFWNTGKLKPYSNVQFGEGGAGTFSDGKLNTLVKDKYGRNKAVLDTFIQFGASPQIAIDAKPHIGTDVLCHVVKNMREFIISHGGQVLFETQCTDILIENNRICGIIVNEKETIPCDSLVLAIGHSARDTFAMLQRKGIPMEPKEFAVGLRVEHPQELINLSQYGEKKVETLGAAPYKLAVKTSSGRGVYSFCMCPGGYVVNASSEEGHTVVNGMSYSNRDGKNANSAIVVTVTPEDYPREGILSGVAFQRQLERRAFLCGQGKIPVQTYGDFKAAVTGDAPTTVNPLDATNDQDMFDTFLSQCKGEYVKASVSEILPEGLNRALLEGMEAFGQQIRGFNHPSTLLLGVESRTSSPVRICRNTFFESDIKGLYPCGEGAGYAGGIMSAAMDGIKVAEAIATRYIPLTDW